MTPVTVATCFARRSGRCAHAPWRPLRPALDFPEPRPGTFPSATCPVGNQTQRSPDLQRRKQPPPSRVPWEDTTLAQVPRGAEVNPRRGVRASSRGKHREEEGGGHRRPRPHTRMGEVGGGLGRASQMAERVRGGLATQWGLSNPRLYLKCHRKRKGEEADRDCDRDQTRVNRRRAERPSGGCAGRGDPAGAPQTGRPVPGA